MQDEAQQKGQLVGVLDCTGWDLAGFGFVVGVLSGRLLFLSLSLLTAATAATAGTAQSARGQGCVCNNVVAVVVVDVVVTQVLMSIEKVEDGLDWQLYRE